MYTNGLIKEGLKEIERITRWKGMGNSLGMINVHTKDNISMIKNMVMEFSHGLTTEYIKVLKII